jgi:DUF177 domain-containing protein
MSSRLPEYIDPWHFGEMGKEVSGYAELSKLPRLAEMLVDQDGKAEFVFRFRKGKKQRIHITGYVCASLKLECQRCLEPVCIPIATEIDAVVVEGFEEAERLPGEYEPLMAGEKLIRLYDVVEDELLLALPYVAMHQDGECQAASQNIRGSDEVVNEDRAQTKPNPFAKLADLKSKKT